MNTARSILSEVKGFTLLITIITFSFFVIGGCNDNGGDGSLGSEGPVTDASACEILTSPCSTISSSTSSDSTTVRCIVSDKSCAVKLDNVISQINGSGFSVTENDILWIGAWGGVGGGADDGGGTSTPGYAQFTTSVSDISTNYNTNILHYFLGGNGLFAPKRCGGSGGAGTIITREDLTLNPTSDPTEDLVLLIGGGGGGAGGSRANGCVGAVGETGASGESAISGTSGNNSAAGGGCNYNVWGCGPSSCGGSCVGASAAGATYTSEGGGSDSADTSGATGGQVQCCINNDNPTSGNSKFGGRGGDGGQGDNCTKVSGGRYFNTGSVELTFDAGKGGNGGGENKSCVKGGGGGGGGYGGGGGGGRGNDNWQPIEGGAGGSYAVESTQSSSLVPSTEPANPCTDSGNPKGLACFVLNFIVD